MTKQELINIVASETGYTISSVEEIMNSTLEIIVHGLKCGDVVRIAPLGSFKPVVRNERLGRNVKTGQPIPIPKRKSVLFKPSTALVEAMKGGTDD